MKKIAKVALIAVILGAALSIWPATADAYFNDCWWDEDDSYCSPDGRACVLFYLCAEGWYGAACTRQRDTGETVWGIWCAD